MQGCGMLGRLQPPTQCPTQRLTQQLSHPFSHPYLLQRDIIMNKQPSCCDATARTHGKARSASITRRPPSHTCLNCTHVPITHVPQSHTSQSDVPQSHTCTGCMSSPTCCPPSPVTHRPRHAEYRPRPRHTDPYIIHACRIQRQRH